MLTSTMNLFMHLDCASRSRAHQPKQEKVQWNHGNTGASATAHFPVPELQNSKSEFRLANERVADDKSSLIAGRTNPNQRLSAHFLTWPVCCRRSRLLGLLASSQSSF